nr:ElyC/SanA/YdcF family protein [Nocardiopsis gilva]
MIAAVIVLLILVPAPFAWITLSTQDRRAGVEDVPQRPVALVLGAGLSAEGRPTTLLRRRLDIAADLYLREKVDAVLVSGDNSFDTYNETDAMREYLVAAGVPDAKIAGDYAGFSTWESCVRAHEIFGVEAATVVTQEFHLARAVSLCEAAGIDIQGVGDPSMRIRTTATVYGYVREVPAAFKAVIDALWQPDPTFLGPKETGVEEALGAPR